MMEMDWGYPVGAIYMQALKSPLAKAFLADPIAKQQLRRYLVSRLPVVIELNGKRYRPEVQPKAC